MSSQYGPLKPTYQNNHNNKLSSSRVFTTFPLLDKNIIVSQSCSRATERIETNEKYYFNKLKMKPVISSEMHALYRYKEWLRDDQGSNFGQSQTMAPQDSQVFLHAEQFSSVTSSSGPRYYMHEMMRPEQPPDAR